MGKRQQSLAFSFLTTVNKVCSEYRIFIQLLSMNNTEICRMTAQKIPVKITHSIIHEHKYTYTVKHRVLYLWVWRAHTHLKQVNPTSYMLKHMHSAGKKTSKKSTTHQIQPNKYLHTNISIQTNTIHWCITILSFVAGKREWSAAFSLFTFLAADTLGLFAKEVGVSCLWKNYIVRWYITGLCPLTCVYPKFPVCWLMGSWDTSVVQQQTHDWKVLGSSPGKIGHSAKSAGGRLQLNTHASCVCGWIKWHCKWCTQNLHRDNGSFMWHLPYDSYTAL